MPRFLVQRAPWARCDGGDRIPHSDKVDPDDPDRADILITLHRLEADGVEIDAKTVEIARVIVHQHKKAAMLPPPRQPAAPAAPEADDAGRRYWVYYVRCGYLIKIGTTANLAGRFQTLRPNELLALEPGGRQLETALHRRFKLLRAGGDYFHPGPALEAHIMELRERLGPPQWEGKLLKDGHDFFADDAS